MTVELLLAHRGPTTIPAACPLAENLKPRVGYGDRVLQLDEAAGRMLQRGLDRDHHAGFEGPVRVFVGVGHRTSAGEMRRLVADETHTMRKEFHVVVVLRFRDQAL